jgi:hypothetical protein
VIATSARLFAFQEPIGIGDNPGSTVVWSSTDGAVWQRVTDQAPEGIRTAIVAGHMLIGAGSEPTSHPCLSFRCVRSAIWTSPDGRVWTRAGTASEFPTGSVAALTRRAHGYLAVGSTIGSPGRAAAPLIWTSTTGREWHQVHHPQGLSSATFGNGALATNPPTVLSFGYRLARSSSTTTTSTTSTTTTTTTVPPASTGGTTSVARLCATLNGTLGGWTTTDGTHWQPSVTRTLGNTNVSFLTYGTGNWIAAGSEGDCTSTRAVLYKSSDGRHWQQLAHDPRVPGSTAVRFPTALTATTTGGLVFVSSFDFPTDRPDLWIWKAPPRHG